MSRSPITMNRCLHYDLAGRQCREPRMEGHAAFCAAHARKHSAPEPPDPQELVRELLGNKRNFRSAASINRVLSRLLPAMIARRIDPRTAAGVTYICQLLIQTLPQIRREELCVSRLPGLQAALERALRACAPGAPLA
jgi:hypothetical protein